MGYRKPFIAASNVNPEILAEYEVGKQFTNGDMESLRTVLEDFVNKYEASKETYEQELERAYNDYSPRRMAENIVNLAEGIV